MTQNLREISTAPLILDDAKKPLSHPIWGYVLGFVGTVFFSMKAIFVKMAYQPSGGLEENAVDAITLMTLRLGFSVPVYLLILFFVMRRARSRGDVPARKSDLLLAALLGMLGYYVCAWLDIDGLQYITAQLERLLLFTYPVFVFVLGPLFFGKPLKKGGVLAILLAYCGIAVIFVGGDIAVGVNVPLGSAMVLSCAVAFAVFQLLAKPMIGRLGSLVFTCAAMLGAGFVIFAHFLIENYLAGTLVSVWDMPLRIYLLGVALAFLSTLIPTFFVNIAIGRIGPQSVAALGMASPVATIVLAIFLLGEPFGWLDGVGTALTLLGIGIYTWSDKRKA